MGGLREPTVEPQKVYANEIRPKYDNNYNLLTEHREFIEACHTFNQYLGEILGLTKRNARFRKFVLRSEKPLTAQNCRQHLG
jgi:hypothetical protein